MANIGTFTKTGNEYKGEIVTMSVQQKNVRIVEGFRAPSGVLNPDRYDPR